MLDHEVLGRIRFPVGSMTKDEVRAAAAAATPAQTLATLDAIATARRRIDSNVAPALTLEAMLISARRSTP
jgi:DNA polymerase-3 subunit delta'